MENWEIEELKEALLEAGPNRQRAAEALLTYAALCLSRDGDSEAAKMTRKVRDHVKAGASHA